tara:strand:- start:433775 stop:434269 length:495 start_codon:yes stop_codon:yes gene_type:complete
MFKFRLLMCLACLQATVSAAENLRITVTQSPPGSGHTISTHTTEAQTTLTVKNGQQVILQRSSGRDYVLQAASPGWTWTQIQQRPEEELVMAITPTLKDENVEVQLNYSARDGDRATHYSSAVESKLGEWIHLTGSGPQQVSGRSYSTSDTGEELWLQVDRTGR